MSAKSVTLSSSPSITIAVSTAVMEPFLALQYKKVVKKAVAHLVKSNLTLRNYNKVC